MSDMMVADAVVYIVIFSSAFLCMAGLTWLIECWWEGD
jgi:hypothetical protein